MKDKKPAIVADSGAAGADDCSGCSKRGNAVSFRLPPDEMRLLEIWADRKGVSSGIAAKAILSGFLQSEKKNLEAMGVVDEISLTVRRTNRKATIATLAMLAQTCIDHARASGTLDCASAEELGCLEGLDAGELWKFYWRMGEKMLIAHGMPDWDKAMKDSLAWLRREHPDRFRPYPNEEF